MSEENINSSAHDQDSEIDILELISTLWNSRAMLLKWSICGAIVGIIIAFSIPKEYDTVVELAPESSEGGSGSGLGSLASMAGISLGSKGRADAVYPTLYPDVVNSVPFITSLFNVEVKTADNGPDMTVSQYMEDEISAPWWSWIMKLPSKIIGWFRSSDGDVETSDVVDPFRLTNKQHSLVNALRSRISATVDDNTSVVTINVMMQDPLVSAILADTVIARLQTYVTAYRTDKARHDLEYAVMLNEEARDNYYDAQQRYADYLDRNQGLTLHSAQTVRDRLQNETELAFNLYNQTAQQVQMARAKVQETTPVYAILTPATVPVKASSPHKMLIIVGFICLTFAACAGWILFGEPTLDEYKAKRRQGDGSAAGAEDAPAKK
ncbi:MAG: chain-length determining protein [Duncaniella sp.]|nr:chain-length determining protein [Duncaniella sp.]